MLQIGAQLFGRGDLRVRGGDGGRRRCDGRVCQVEAKPAGQVEVATAASARRRRRRLPGGRGGGGFYQEVTDLFYFFLAKRIFFTLPET